MTAKTLDNDDQQQAYPYDFGVDADYDTAQNDEYNVQLIVFSLGYPLDGPGDGNSDVREPYSPILSADKAIENGAIWFSAAGNYGTSTWFSRAPTYRDNVLDFDDTANHESCNDLTVLVAEITENPTPLERYLGGPNHDLDLVLYKRSPDLTTMSMVNINNDTQAGQAQIRSNRDDHTSTVNNRRQLLHYGAQEIRCGQSSVGPTPSTRARTLQPFHSQHHLPVRQHDKPSGE